MTFHRRRGLHFTSFRTHSGELRYAFVRRLPQGGYSIRILDGTMRLLRQRSRPDFASSRRYLERQAGGAA